MVYIVEKHTFIDGDSSEVLAVFTTRNDADNYLKDMKYLHGWSDDKDTNYIVVAYRLRKEGEI